MSHLKTPRLTITQNKDWFHDSVKSPTRSKVIKLWLPKKQKERKPDLTEFEVYLWMFFEDKT